jgi:hypothetical protein
MARLSLKWFFEIQTGFTLSQQGPKNQFGCFFKEVDFGTSAKKFVKYREDV